MKLSIIIVNYNTRYFIQLCLHSVLRALKSIESEVIVVDNKSVDDSCEVILNRFPEVQLICNTENSGFAKANNKGIKRATGTYVLLLNPDTIVPEDCFVQVLQYMESHPEASNLWFLGGGSGHGFKHGPALGELVAKCFVG